VALLALALRQDTPRGSAFVDHGAGAPRGTRAVHPLLARKGLAQVAGFKGSADGNKWRLQRRHLSNAEHLLRTELLCAASVIAAATGPAALPDRADPRQTGGTVPRNGAGRAGATCARRLAG